MLNHDHSLYLSENYAPVEDELDVKNLDIIGEIPDDLIGIYMRNGPNPAYPPISYTYPFDGDGMIHAVYLADKKAHYRNRFVMTKALQKEHKAGKALYGGVLKPIPIEPQWAGPEDEPIAIKNGAFIHIIRHANQYLAMWEGGPAYEMTQQLKTIGEWTPGSSPKPINVCPHTRLDPVTGNLWLVNYDIVPPYLTIYCVDAQGKLIFKQDIDKPHSTMFHDFVLTEQYVVVFECPVVFDLQKAMAGGEMLSWRPDLSSRIGIMPKTGGSMQWIETDPFFVFHFANAYEQNTTIKVDYVRHEKFSLLQNDQKDKSVPQLFRTEINMLTKKIIHQVIDDRLVEFPRIREDRDTFPHRYIYTPTKTNENKNERAFNALIKYDVKEGTSRIHNFGACIEIGEAVFAPKLSSKQEDDGYVILFVYDSSTKQSEFVILDAQDFEANPLARIKMPRRIPHGLHGSWMPGEWSNF